jgi:hypothetical protein
MTMLYIISYGTLFIAVLNFLENKPYALPLGGAVLLSLALEVAEHFLKAAG